MCLLMLLFARLYFLSSPVEERDINVSFADRTTLYSSDSAASMQQRHASDNHCVRRIRVVDEGPYEERVLAYTPGVASRRRAVAADGQVHIGEDRRPNISLNALYDDPENSVALARSMEQFEEAVLESDAEGAWRQISALGKSIGGNGTDQCKPRGSIPAPFTQENRMNSSNANARPDYSGSLRKAKSSRSSTKGRLVSWPDIVK